MGLDVSHDAWHGSYGSFRVFRETIASNLGIPLPLMEGFWSPTGPTEHLLKAGQHGKVFKDYERWLPIKWTHFEDDPICILLYHSDCDGEITVDDLKLLTPRLLEILPEMKTALYPRFDIEWVKDKIAEFAGGCGYAIEKGEELSFH